MDPEIVKTVANDSLSKAKSYVARNIWSRAYPHYLVYFELIPSDKNKYQEEFVTVLYNYGMTLEEEGRFDDLENVYEKALLYFPEHRLILNNFAAHLLRLNEPQLALEYLNRIQDISLSVAKNIQTAKLEIIPRWHYRMLNDQKRNNAYYKAIHEVITDEHNVIIDIGAGCGLLSYYASKSKNTKSITAIESCSALCEIATMALKDCHNIKIINKLSTELTGLESVAVATLAITEIFDAALFGEHVLETLIHAWKCLLMPTAKIIPSSADLFITGISSKAILSRHKLCNKIPELGIDDLCVTQLYHEPYEAENLKDKPVQYITETGKVVHVDFNNVEQLENLYNIHDCIPVVTLKCISSGTIDAFAIWFDLHLTENVTITTDPQKDNVKCWEQAIIYLDHPISLKTGEEVKVQVSCVTNKLEVKVLSPKVNCNNCMKVSQALITFLNDIQIVEAACDLTLTKYICGDCNVLDLNPFPLFALQQAKKGLKANIKCVASNELDSAFIDFVWNKNLGHYRNFKIINSLKLEESLLPNSLDVVFASPISNNGILCEEMFNKFKNFITKCTKSTSLIFPTITQIQIEIIDSNYLDICSKVDDNNLLGFKVAKLMNKYSISEQWEVEPQYYKRKTLCHLYGHACCLHYLNICDSVYEVNIPINGRANGVLYWYKMIYVEDKVVINTYKSLHYKGACFIFEPVQNVKKGSQIYISLQQNKGLCKITNVHDHPQPPED